MKRCTFLNVGSNRSSAGEHLFPPALVHHCLFLRCSACRLFHLLLSRRVSLKNKSFHFTAFCGQKNTSDVDICLLNSFMSIQKHRSLKDGWILAVAEQILRLKWWQRVKARTYSSRVDSSCDSGASENWLAGLGEDRRFVDWVWCTSEFWNLSNWLFVLRRMMRRENKLYILELLIEFAFCSGHHHTCTISHCHGQGAAAITSPWFDGWWSTNVYSILVCYTNDRPSSTWTTGHQQTLFAW